MKTLILCLCAFAVFLTVGGCAVQLSPNSAENKHREVQLTVFKADFGEVQEVRTFNLAPGGNDLQLDRISRLIDPATPLYDWLDGFPAEVVSSSYQVGAGTVEELLQQFEGKEVGMVWFGQDGRRGSRVSGILEKAEPGQIVLRTSDGLLVNPSGTFVLPDETGLAIRPSLLVRATAKTGGRAKLRFSYQTRGLSWTADYTAFIDSASEEMALECWALVQNDTGIAYPAKKLALVAGSPNRAVLSRDVSESLRLREDKTLVGAPEPGNPAGPAQQGDLYRYEVDAPGLIAHGQLNRVKLFSFPRFSVKRDYAIALPTLGPYSDFEWPSRAQEQRRNAVLTLTFGNDKASGPGMTLPAGTVRIYETDTAGKRFIGASAIRDTPEDKKVNLAISNVFEVYSDFLTVSTKRLDAKTVLKDYQATVRNSKSTPVRVRLVASLSGYPILVAESHKGANIGAGRRQWLIDVPAKSEARLKFAIKFRP